tara:strand:+ start:87 stop:422 length:336 start_codon:yes stop_codon:yes gene_type:complete
MRKIHYLILAAFSLLVVGSFAYDAKRPEEVKDRTASKKRVVRVRAIQAKNTAAIDSLKLLDGYIKTNPSSGELRELLHEIIDVMLENSTNGIGSVVSGANARRELRKRRRP